MPSILFMPFDPQHMNFLTVQVEYSDFYTDIDGSTVPLQRNNVNQKNSKWVDHDLTKNEPTAVVWYNGSVNAHISSLNTESIYIRGHSEPGWNIITGAKSGAENVHWSVLCDRLIQSGLSKSFRGKLKCYNCHSAESAKPGSHNYVDTGKPFAQEFADEMYTRGYKSCSFYGYKGSLDSYPKDYGGATHKHTHGDYLLDGTSDREDLGRASFNRVAFMGTYKANRVKRLFYSIVNR